MNTTPFSIFCDILLPTNRRTKKDASAVPHPILRILLILSQIVILRPRIRDSLQQPMRLHSYEIRTKKIVSQKIVSFINFYKDYYENRSDHRKESLYEFPRGHEHLRLFLVLTSSLLLIPLFLSFFLFNSFLYRCRARARKKMKNARFLLRSVCDRFLFRTSNVPLSFFFII